MTDDTPIYLELVRDWRPRPTHLRLVTQREAQSRAALKVVHDDTFAGVAVLAAVKENA